MFTITRYYIKYCVTTFWSSNGYQKTTKSEMVDGRFSKLQLPLFYVSYVIQEYNNLLPHCTCLFISISLYLLRPNQPTSQTGEINSYHESNFQKVTLCKSTSKGKGWRRTGDSGMKKSVVYTDTTDILNIAW